MESSSLSSTSSVMVKSKNENIDPRQLRKSVFNGESINSENSHFFSLSTRQYVFFLIQFLNERKSKFIKKMWTYSIVKLRRRQNKKAALRAKQAKPPPPKKDFLNLKPAFYVPPLRFEKPTNLETSTPAKQFSAAVPVELVDISCIDNADAEELALKAIDAHDQMQTDANNQNKSQPKNDPKPPVHVATRRRLIPDQGKQLVFSVEEEHHTEHIGVENVEEMSVISLINSFDMHSIDDFNENGAVDEDPVIISHDSNMVSKTKDESILNISDVHSQNEDAVQKIDRGSISTDSFAIIQQYGTLPTVVNDSSIWIDRTQAIQVIAEIHHSPIDTISVSSASNEPTSASTLSTTSAPITTTAINQKQSIRPKVGFDDSNSIHELSEMSQRHELSQKIVIKGGKWRRTIFEFRKNKVTQCKLEL